MVLLRKLNKKSKQLARHFFIETKCGIWLMRSMALLNAVEGMIHLIVAGVGTWGVVDEKVFDLRILLPIIENVVLGAFSLLTGWALGIKHEHHHHEYHHELSH